MPTFDNEKLIDAVKQRLATTRVAPSLSRTDSEIFFKTMSDDLFKQLCGKGSTAADKDLTYLALQKKIGASPTILEHALPRVRVGLGAFYFASQPEINRSRERGMHGEAPASFSYSPASPERQRNEQYYDVETFPTGPIGIAIYEDYLIKYGLKCRRALSVKQLPDGTAAPTDINASRMYFEAANALTSYYGRTGGMGGGSGEGTPAIRSNSRAGVYSAFLPPQPLNNKKSLLTPATITARPSSSASIRSSESNNKNKSNSLSKRPASGGCGQKRVGSAAQPSCILDDLPNLRQELCRKFVQAVAEVIGEAASAGNDVEICLHPKLGTLKIKQKVISFTIAATGDDAKGDPASALPSAINIPSRRKYFDREQALAQAGFGREEHEYEEDNVDMFGVIRKDSQFVDDEEGAENGDGGGGEKSVVVRAKAPMSNKMKLILQKREAEARGKDYVEPMDDTDSAFSSPSMNARRAEKKNNDNVSAEKMNSQQTSAANADDGTTESSPTKNVDAVRKLLITSKFEPKIELDTSSASRRLRPQSSYSASVRIGSDARVVPGIQRSAASSSSSSPAAVISRLDAKLASLRAQLNDPLEEIEHNMYGDYAPPPTPPPSFSNDTSGRKLGGRNSLESPAAIYDRRKTEDEMERFGGKVFKPRTADDFAVEGPDPNAISHQRSNQNPNFPNLRGVAAATATRNANRASPILHHTDVLLVSKKGNGSTTSEIKPFANNNPNIKNIDGVGIVPATKINVRKDAQLINNHVQINRRLHSLKEQDVDTIDDMVTRRAGRKVEQQNLGAALLKQSQMKSEQRVKDAAAAMVIQQKETEVQVLSEALAVIERTKRKREAKAAAAELGDTQAELSRSMSRCE